MGPPSSDAEPTLRGFAAGVKVFGRYTLMEMLGRGGMGVVWRAKDAVLGEDVALKFLPDAVRWDSGAYEDLKDETRRARQLTHPNIVRIHDFVEDGGSAAISMEVVEGATLTALRLAKPAKILEVADIAAWLPQLGAALAYAHEEAKVVHRDLKPANLMLTREGRLKVADFGVARSMADSISRVSMMTAGTLVYMSPQQAMGEEPAPTDDVYAVGATLYELLTGKPPFHTGDVRMQLFQRKPESMAARRKVLGVQGEPIPAAWEAAVVACLAKEPADRPASVREFLRRLQQPAAPGRRWWRAPIRRWAPGRRVMVLGAVAVALGALTLFVPWGRPGAAPAVVAFPSDATRALAAWNLDGDARDGSGRGFDGLSGNATPTFDRFGRIDRAMYFNGNAGIRLPDVPDFRWSGRQPFTAAIWVRQDESPTMSGVFWSSNGLTVNSLMWSLGFNEGRLWAELGLNHNDDRVSVVAPARAPFGQWQHVALVSDGTECRLHVDGKQVAQRALGATLAAPMPAAVEMTLGKFHKNSSWAMTGAMDDARLWRRALTVEEIEGLVVRTIPSRLVISAGSYFETDDLSAAIRTEFGDQARLADWTEFKRRWADDARTGAQDLGITVGGTSGWVTRDGQRRFDERRYFFVNRFDGVQPSYYGTHDEICGLTFALGSWYNTRAPAVVELPAPAITTETLYVPAGERRLRRPGGLEANRVAAALFWRAHLTTAAERGMAVRLQLADLSYLQAVCDTGPKSLALALGPVGPGAMSHNVGAGFGDFDFAVVVRDRKLVFRAESVVGRNALFSRELPLPNFNLADIVAIEIEGGPNSGLAAATLVVE